MAKIETVKVIVNNPELARILNVKPNGVVNVECKRGVPIEREWRNRFADAKIDKCITLPKGFAKTKPVKKEG